MKLYDNASDIIEVHKKSVIYYNKVYMIQNIIHMFVV